jgi:hypothetical protein
LTVAVALLFSPTNSSAYDINDKFSIGGVMAGDDDDSWKSILTKAMLGELTPKMAEAITSCPAPKILLPLAQEKVVLVGVVSEPLPHLVQLAVNEKIKEVLTDV